MKDTGTQIIPTERFILRRFTTDDAQAMFKWACDNDVTRYMNWDSHKSIETTKYIISTWVACYKKDDFYLWAITNKNSNEPIGSIDYHDINKRIESLEVGFCLLKKYWKQGIMTEVLKTTNDYMLNIADYNRIEGFCDIENKSSAKVMQKCGMIYEGVRRHGGKYDDGHFCDVDVYSIIKADIKKI
ncbi:MAG: GNAT family N-acetyltransferase [Endomicrobium sp.]|jgi:RimJ/RimL family protein N-acetyltransferase|nr:GNAT family N-acetyltransferase [Endomicrobium sp.]